MSEAPSSKGNPITQAVVQVGQAAYGAVDGVRDRISYFGGTAYLFFDTLTWIVKSLTTKGTKLRTGALASQMVRVGVRSIPIVLLVQFFIGIILALQMAPTLRAYGQIQQTATIIAIAVFRELGPLISAIVLSGFAGASIAAEIGAMVEAEEVKALKAHALNPIHFLVMPRMLATVIMLIGLTVLANVVGVLGGLTVSWGVLDIGPYEYIETTRMALKEKDFLTGLFKAGVFGMLISLIASYEGLNVRGGAVGVGNATTATVVKSIVALIATDCMFTAIFFVYEL